MNIKQFNIYENLLLSNKKKIILFLPLSIQMLISNFFNKYNILKKLLIFKKKNNKNRYNYKKFNKNKIHQLHSKSKQFILSKNKLLRLKYHNQIKINVKDYLYSNDSHNIKREETLKHFQISKIKLTNIKKKLLLQNFIYLNKILKKELFFLIKIKKNKKYNFIKSKFIKLYFDYQIILSDYINNQYDLWLNKKFIYLYDQIYLPSFFQRKIYYTTLFKKNYYNKLDEMYRQQNYNLNQNYHKILNNNKLIFYDNFEKIASGYQINTTKSFLKRVKTKKYFNKIQESNFFTLFKNDLFNKSTKLYILHKFKKNILQLNKKKKYISYQVKKLKFNYLSNLNFLKFYKYDQNDPQNKIIQKEYLMFNFFIQMYKKWYLPLSNNQSLIKNHNQIVMPFLKEDNKHVQQKNKYNKNSFLNKSYRDSKNKVFMYMYLNQVKKTSVIYKNFISNFIKKKKHFINKNKKKKKFVNLYKFVFFNIKKYKFKSYNKNRNNKINKKKKTSKNKFITNKLQQLKKKKNFKFKFKILKKFQFNKKKLLYEYNIMNHNFNHAILKQKYILIFFKELLKKKLKYSFLINNLFNLDILKIDTILQTNYFYNIKLHYLIKQNNIIFTHLNIHKINFIKKLIFNKFIIKNINLNYLGDFVTNFLNNSYKLIKKSFLFEIYHFALPNILFGSILISNLNEINWFYNLESTFDYTEKSKFLSKSVSNYFINLLNQIDVNHNMMLNQFNFMYQHLWTYNNYIKQAFKVKNKKLVLYNYYIFNNILLPSHNIKSIFNDMSSLKLFYFFIQLRLINFGTFINYLTKINDIKLIILYYSNYIIKCVLNHYLIHNDLNNNNNITNNILQFTLLKLLKLILIKKFFLININKTKKSNFISIIKQYYNILLKLNLKFKRLMFKFYNNVNKLKVYKPNKLKKTNYYIHYLMYQNKFVELKRMYFYFTKNIKSYFFYLNRNKKNKLILLDKANDLLNQILYQNHIILKTFPKKKIYSNKKVLINLKKLYTEIPKIIIKTTKRNCFITVCNFDNTVIRTFSCGRLGFKKKKKILNMLLIL